MKPTLQQYMNAGYSGVFITSHEETRVEAEVAAAAAGTSRTLYAWSVASGVTIPAQGTVVPDTEDPVAMVRAFASLPERSVMLARDFHAFMGGANEQPNPVLIRLLKEALTEARAKRTTLVMSGYVTKIAPELEKLIVLMDIPLPTRETLDGVLSSILADSKKKVPADVKDLILDASAGMTTTEAEDAYALSITVTESVSPELVYELKCQAVKRNGLLEVVEPKTTLSDVGGLENAKAVLDTMRGLFTKEARAFGLPSPRGWLVVGQPGTGKSLMASTMQSVFGIPVLRLEAGRLFGSLVGQSEANWRTAFATAKAVGQCVLWVDEVDGLFAGSTGASTDGGTTQRVIKAILQDMQMSSDGIFFMFTANDVDRLPDPLIDRLDVWSVDLPRHEERESIWRIHIAKNRTGEGTGRDPKKFDLNALAKATEGFSGRQIEQVWLAAVAVAFSKGRQPTTADVVAVANSTTATSVLMKDAIEARRNRLAKRARPAGRLDDAPSAPSFGTSQRAISGKGAA